MEASFKQNTFLFTVIPLGIIAVGLAVFVFILYGEREELRASEASLTERLNTAESTINQLENSLSTTSNELAMTMADREQLAKRLDEEKERNENFEDQIDDLSGTIGQLDKLSKIDPELLQKYSRVFFLSENYIPEKLIQIEKKYLYNEDDPTFLHKEVEDFLYDMLEDAEDDDIELWVVSAYRSFDEQRALKGDYLTTYGSGANAFSADQGYSEHQLGTTVDFTTTGLNGGLDGFENTEAYEWLLANAHRHGFVLSYPEGNEYYVFEPWHWRFVGTDLARDLDDDGKHFYDLEQRELDEYLISIFD